MVEDMKNNNWSSDNLINIFPTLLVIMIITEPMTTLSIDCAHLFTNESISIEYNNSQSVSYGYGNWTKILYSNVGSSYRASPEIAIDLESDRIILFGGIAGNGRALNDTWAYDRNNNMWTNMNPNISPTCRMAQMTYDIESDRIILFGGSNGRLINDTWAYDYNTNTWKNMSPSISPSPRYSDLTYDSTNDRVILFGGSSESIFVNGTFKYLFANDTWSYDYNTNTWTNMSPTIHPSSRLDHRLSYDSDTNNIVLFGGHIYISASLEYYLNDTWIYNYNTNKWINVTTSSIPHWRMGHSMSYNLKIKRTVLFGGSFSFNGLHYLNDTWIYDCNANIWLNITPSTSPEIRAYHVMIYDQKRNQNVLYGGTYILNGFPRTYDEIWIYELGKLSPFVIATDPINEDKEISIDKKIVITFSSVMNKSATERAISLSPGSIINSNWGNRNTTIILFVTLEPRTEYIVTINTSARDIEGITMEHNYIFSFSTISSTPELEWIFPTSIIMIIIISLILLIILYKRKKRRK